MGSLGEGASSVEWEGERVWRSWTKGAIPVPPEIWEGGVGEKESVSVSSCD